MATTTSATLPPPLPSPPSPSTISPAPRGQQVAGTCQLGSQWVRHGTTWAGVCSLSGCGSHVRGSSIRFSGRVRLLTRGAWVLALVLLLGSLHSVRATAAAPKVFQMSSQREDTPDFFNDYWNDEQNGYLKGEVQRLMREYPENQQFVQNLDSQYFQIIYPVQVQRHGKSQGISTRDASKITSNHVHRTSYRIKAFSHVFTVDLELNTQLLGPNVKALHQTRDGRNRPDQRVEHCYYHGTVKDYTGAIAAFRTCDGLAGIIQLGNETLIVSPMTGGETLPKHPHFVSESKNLHITQKCGVTKNYDDWSGGSRYQMGGARGRRRKQTHHRYTRNVNVRQTTKYIETALFLDKRFMEVRNLSTSRALNDALQIANIADLYFKTINTRLTVTYLETWSYQNPIQLGRQVRLSNAVIHFYEHVQKTVHEPKDTAQLITGERYQGGESGIAVPNSICSDKAAGISLDMNVYEPHLVASTMTHMIGHNLHMQHDDGRPNCFCQDWHGCIMSQTVVGQDNVQPSKFSKCSTEDYIRAISNADEGRCLLQPSLIRPPGGGNPYQPSLGGRGKTTVSKPGGRDWHQSIGGPRCGDGKVDEGEQCDCGPAYKCDLMDPCCEKNTCKLKLDAQCATGPCCKDCKVQSKYVQCRKAESECDIPEVCDGIHGTCPMNTYKKNGNKCGGGRGYCYNGVCPTLDNQCAVIWGYGGQASDKMCYQQFNKEGVQYGNCGKSKNGSYIRCEAGDIMCGTLQCQMGMQHPISPSMDQSYSRTIVAMAGQEYECKTVRYENRPERSDEPDWTLVHDGTACGENLVCYNHTCTSIYPFIEQGKCMSNNKALECSGHGVCSNVNTCYCNHRWKGDDCSIFDNTIPEPPPTESGEGNLQIGHTVGPPTTTTTSWNATQGKNTQYVGQQGSDTVFLVIVLVSGMGGVFFAFACMALCYRRKSTMPKYDPPYMKRPIVKKPPQQHMQQPMGISKTEETSLQGVDMGSRIITFGNLPSYSPGRPPLSPSLARSRSLDSCREHKMNSMKRSGPPGCGSQSEEEALQSGEDEAVSFIELPPNNLSKIPEKGILKKSYGLTPAEKEKWSEESQSDNNDVMSQSDNNADPECQVSEVERTLKSLNGYHEDIIDALKRAASHRSGTTSMSSDEIHTAHHHDTFPRYPAGAASLGGPGEFTRLKMSHENLKLHHGDSGGEDDQVPPCGPIRIRNLEDLIRQLEHHPSRHMSPSGSEEIRMSETEADRHYRLDSSSCTESQGGRGGTDNGGVGFVYGRYRQPPSSGSASGATSSQRGSDRLACDYSDGQDSHAYTEEDDLERHDAGETADSESDEFVVLPKGIRGHAGQYFWPVGK